MSQELLQIQEDGKLIDQYLRQEPSELEQRGTAASERSPVRGKRRCRGCIGLSAFIINARGKGRQQYNSRKHRRKNKPWKWSLRLEQLKDTHTLPSVSTYAEEGTVSGAQIQQHLQKLALVETIVVVFPLAVSLQQQVVQAKPDLPIQFCHLQMVLNGDRLPFAIDVLLQLTYRGSQAERRSTRDCF